MLTTGLSGPAFGSRWSVTIRQFRLGNFCDDRPASFKKSMSGRPRRDVQVPDALALVQVAVKIQDITNGVRLFSTRPKFD